MEAAYSGGLQTMLAGSTMNEQVKCMQSLVERHASDVIGGQFPCISTYFRIGAAILRGSECRNSMTSGILQFTLRYEACI